MRKLTGNNEVVQSNMSAGRDINNLQCYIDQDVPISNPITNWIQNQDEHWRQWILSVLQNWYSTRFIGLLMSGHWSNQPNPTSPYCNVWLAISRPIIRLQELDLIRCKIQKIPNVDLPTSHTRHSVIKLTRSIDSPIHKLDLSEQTLPAGGS